MAKELTFRQRYVGPDGPHLNCLTSTTRKGTYEEKDQRSIHPRHWPITGHGVKKNTKKEKSRV